MANFNVEFQEHSKSFGVKFEDNNNFKVDFGQIIVLSDVGETYILVDANGNEVVGVVVDNEVVFDATANDIRLGKTAATEGGVTLGEKVIPTYFTTEGMKIITSGKMFSIELLDSSGIERYDYTKLQVIICPRNKTLLDSVSAEKVVINNKVYEVNSTQALGDVTKNSTKRAIELNVINETNIPYILRFFTYKEIE